jgi:septal ring factor EnvC (AmiA/AmiB activator)
MIRIAAVLIALAGPVIAQDDPAEAAQAAAEQLTRAGLALTNASGGRNRVAALTEAVKGYEDGLIAMRDGLRRAAIRQQTLETSLEAKSAEIGELLGVLQSIGRAPAPLLLLHPSGPTGTARSGMIVAEVTPALHAQADVLRSQLEELAVLRVLQESAEETLTLGLHGAQTARAALSLAIQERTDLPQRFVEDEAQTALLLTSTDTLDSFASGLAGTALQGPENTDALAAKGALPIPVQGQILRGFNTADAAGVTRPGVIIATRPRALVTSPTPATILFRGPLLDYGNVMIIEPTADVMFIFAGLAEVYGEVGEIIGAGAPLGLLGGSSPQSDADLTEISQSNAGAQSQTLYLEVRDGQAPVNPATWFAIE